MQTYMAAYKDRSKNVPLDVIMTMNDAVGCLHLKININNRNETQTRSNNTVEQ